MLKQRTIRFYLIACYSNAFSPFNLEFRDFVQKSMGCHSEIDSSSKFEGLRNRTTIKLKMLGVF